MSTRYSKRSATCGATTLNSSRERGHTLQFWFWINVGKTSCGRDKWVEFDIRDLAKQVGVSPPEMLSSEDYDSFEQFLEAGLQRAANWCENVNAIGWLTKAEQAPPPATTPRESGSAIDLDALERAALAAEGAKFNAEGFEQTHGRGDFYGGLIMHENSHTIVAQCAMQPWADFIAAANPAVVLELIRLARLGEAARLQLIPGDVLAVRIRDDVSREEARALGELFQKSMPEKCTMIFTKPGVDLSVISEDAMRVYGWVRSGPVEAALQLAADILTEDRDSLKEAHTRPDGEVDEDAAEPLERYDQALAAIAAVLPEAT